MIKRSFYSKIFNYVGDDLVEKLQLQDKFLSVKPNIPNNIKQYLNWYFQLILDKVLLIAYLYENENFLLFRIKNFLVKQEDYLCLMVKKTYFLVWRNLLF